MREIPNSSKPLALRLIQPLVFGGLLFALGAWVGATLFPVTETTLVVKPVEVPAEKVVVKSAQAPPDQVSVPQSSLGVPAGYSETWVSAWDGMAKGLSQPQVRRMLGEPLRVSRGGVEEWYYLADTQRGCVFFFMDQAIHWNGP